MLKSYKIKPLSLIIKLFSIFILSSITSILVLSCRAGVNLGEADKVLTSFHIEWEEGFDSACRSNEPVELTVYALDQYGEVFDWNETITISLTNANITVNPSVIEVTHGSGMQSIAFFNGTGANHAMLFWNRTTR